MSLKWEAGCVGNKISKKALEGGKDTDGSVIYVGRANFNGACLPAKVIPSKGACYVGHNGSEISVQSFEVLIDDKRLSWEPASDGRVAAGAVSTGRDGNDEMFIGRAPFQSSLTVGKIHPTHRCLYLPFNGREERVTHYEVLVYNSKKANLHWLPSTSYDAVHRDAVVGGRDTDGAAIYVGRAEHFGDVLPCKVIPGKQVAYVSHNGAEVSKHNFEILIGSDAKWKKEKHGKVPKKAFDAGCRTSSGEALFIGRVENVKGTTTVGKIHPSHGCLYIPFDGKEMSFRDYEVLTGN